MIVWGGGTSGAYSNTGGRYNPATDSWTATSTGTTSLPPRFITPAVWTGTRDDRLGRLQRRDPVNTGGRYNPATNTWTATSVGANVPARAPAHGASGRGAR